MWFEDKLPLKAFIALLFALIFAAPICPQSAQQQKPQPESPSTTQGAVTIRAHAAEVLVDALVMDKRNKLVSDLKPEDFKVFEDGVEQKILSCRLARTAQEPTVQTAPPSATSPEIATPKPAQERAPLQMANLTILLLDRSTTVFENQKLVQDASTKYVEERLKPNDLMAVFVLGNSLRFVTDFTNDKTRLLAALRSKDVLGSALSAESASLAGDIASARSTASTGPPDVSTVLPASGPGAAAAGAALAASGSARAAVMLAERIEANFVALQSAMNKRVTRGILTAIRAIAMGVSQIEGRKSLILFSQGFVVGEELEDQLHAVVEVANRARLAVYSIDARGLETGWEASQSKSGLGRTPELSAVADKSQRDRMQARDGATVFDRAIESGSDQAESALRYISNETGGFYRRNTNDLGVAMKQVDEEMHGYYLISYRPSNPNYDGKLRQIRVEVRPPGLTVKARTGYYAVPTGFEFLSHEEFQVFQAAHTTGASAPLFVRAGGFREEGKRYRVPVVLEMPAKSIRFERSGKLSIARLQVIGLVRDLDHNLVARFGGKVEYSANEADYKILEPGNISLMNSVELPPGNYILETAVKDLVSGGGAYRERGLYLRDQQPELALSTVLLAKNVDKAAASGSQFLSVGGTKILPSAQCEYRNGENLIFYFDIYGPRIQPENKADVTVNLWLMRNGQRLNVGLPAYRLMEAESKPLPHITVARYVQLAGLDPGDYSLIVQVRDALAARTELAHASFTVVK